MCENMLVRKNAELNKRKRKSKQMMKSGNCQTRKIRPVTLFKVYGKALTLTTFPRVNPMKDEICNK